MLIYEYDNVTPETPDVVSNEVANVYVPVASYTQKGIAKFNSNDFKIDSDGEVKIDGKFLTQEDIASITGDDPLKVMSQEATTKEINRLDADILTAKNDATSAANTYTDNKISEVNARIDTKVSKVTPGTMPKVYTMMPDGVEMGFPATFNKDATTFVYRDVNGRAKFADPSDIYDASNKNYVDTVAATKLDRKTSPSEISVYAEDPNGEAMISVSSNGFPYTSMFRDVNGRSKVSDPDPNSATDIANVKFVKEQVAGIVNSAPETLDTLQELSKALGDDPNFATTVTTELGKKAVKTEVDAELTNKLDKANVVQTMGDSTTAVMSQKAATDFFAQKDEVNALKEDLDNNTECFLTGENKNIGLHNGYISLSNGGTNTDIFRCVFTDFLPNTEVVFSSENSEYIIYLLKYNMSDNSFVGNNVVNSNKRPYTIHPSTQYKYKVAFCNTRDMNAEKTEAELLDIRNKLILYFKNPLEKRVKKIEDSVFITEKISLIKQDFSVGVLQTAGFSVNTSTHGMTYLKHIQAQTGDTISVVVPTVDGVIFKYRFGFYDSEKNYLDQIPFSETNEITVTVSDTEYIAFCIIAYNSDGTNHTNIINDFSQNDIFVFENKARFVGIDRLHSEIVELQNKKREYRAIIDAAMKPKNITSNGYLSQLQPLALFHFSDIHGDAIETDRIGSVYQDIVDKCDDVVCTGDIVELRYSNDATFMTDGSRSKKYLLAIGNHDVLTDESGFDFTQRATQEQQYEKFFAKNIANWGVTYTENKTYYYKDYSTKKIRLIVLNNMLTSTDATEQLTWLETTLADSITNDYSVVIGMHYPVYGFTKIDCVFTRRDREIPPSDCADVSICQAVQTFIDGGGDFICYVCGHKHGDYIGYSSAYPSQISILVDSASRAQSNQYSDLMRVDDELSQDVYNVVVFDKSVSAIKLIRIGCDVDNYMRRRDMICLDYHTKEILSCGLPVYTGGVQ